ncbi:unnamed protein product [Kuraishia capsulata CBS 1993]|uniref:TFIIS central domain-containing protein n=1 Tax=Kuraishia capsulata CBS 1993 TaxID=1382522 RepID=W6MT61_9ASCO|nr:uncharacterized protein KUCA_T00004379001 [Kuraishia capsulata CBS 1993]CDK28397.1 unnamed protein product [Kuraishia capsulata CBS 1993]
MLYNPNRAMVNLRDRAKRYHSKKETPSEGPADNVADVWNTTRKACVAKITEILENAALAKSYEGALYQKNHNSLEQYRTSFRKDVIALRNSKTGFREAIKNKEITPEQFALLKPEELFSKEQKLENEKLKDQELQAAISTETKALPKNINALKDSVVSEKWGISTSAAAIDDFEEE